MVDQPVLLLYLYGSSLFQILEIFPEMLLACLVVIFPTCRGKTKAAGNEPDDLAPVLGEPHDGRGHGDDGDHGEGGRAQAPVHQGQAPHQAARGEAKE